MPDLTKTELEARVAQLEAENARLRAESTETTDLGEGLAATSEPVAPVKRGRGRTAAAIVLVVVGLLLAPVAVISGWARLELVDTDRFVATFAPLAEDPAVQSYIGDQVTAAIEEQVDIPQLTSDVFDGIRALDLPPRAEAALGLLEAPAAQGLQSLVDSVVDRVIASPAFADIWAAALRASHRQAVAAIQGDPNAALEIGGDGTLSVQLGPIIEAVKQRLEEQGVGFAAQIPVIDRSIVVAQADAFVTVRTVYQLAVAAGTWLPWIVLAFLIGGVLVAKRRSRAIMWTAGGLALTMLLMAGGLSIGRLYFVGAVSPSIMPADAAQAIYDDLIVLMQSTIVAFFVLGLLVAVVAWFSGPWRPARAARGFAESGFTAVRRSAASHGVTTGAFGVALDRWRTAAYIGIAVIAAIVVLFSRPLETSTVVVTLIVALVALLLVELLRRPAAEVAEYELERAEADPSTGVATSDTPVIDPESGTAPGDTAVLDAGDGAEAAGHPADPARPVG
ncbi:bZIP transcription factor [Agromyces humatus]|uniref:Integral membrane protein n=1 Tax=Agromyces humatus TaxID=279573 RepID=A0ABP4X5L6_9MICO|nr:bZIP transcription factor [Agromyces humatus]